MKAINVAIQLPQHLCSAAKRFNSVLRTASPTTGFDFDSTHIPHLTLAQCFIEEGSLPLVIQEVNSALSGEEPLRLEVEKIEEGPNFNGNLLPGFSIKLTKQLSSLQEKIHDCVKPFSHSPGSNATKASAFFSTEAELREGVDMQNVINSDSLKYVTKFLTEKSRDNYTAHVTVGAAPPEVTTEVVQQFKQDWKERTCEGEAGTLMIAHLGNYCTCRKILHSWDL